MGKWEDGCGCGCVGEGGVRCRCGSVCVGGCGRMREEARLGIWVGVKAPPEVGRDMKYGATLEVAYRADSCIPRALDRHLPSEQPSCSEMRISLSVRVRVRG